MRSQSPHRLVIPFTAALAVVLHCAVFVTLFHHGVDLIGSVALAAVLSFAVVVAIGIAFKPLLGE